MPVSLTKNKKSKEELNRLIQKAFPNECTQDIIELKEGFFNVAYQIIFKSGLNTILKIAPPVDIEIMTYEKNIMFSEVDSMKMIQSKTKAPVAKIIFYDSSHSLCDSDYFFMEMLEGRSLSSCMDSLSEKDRNNIYFQMGQYTYMLNEVKGLKFGYYGQKDKQGDNWYLVFKSMIEDIYYDAKRKDTLIPVPKDDLLLLLEKDREIFEQIKEPSFVHWDIWAGNVFVQNGSVSGIIDFERCLWADPLMEVGFRTYGYEKSFFDGYRTDKLDEAQEKRAKWYDIYLFLILCPECDYRMYDNRWFYDWGSEMLIKWIEEKREKR